MAKYREKVGNSVRITNKGIPLDDAWSELSALYPGLFPEDTTDADQPIVMAEVISMLNDNLKYNPIAEKYRGNEAAALMDAVAKIVDGFHNIPELVDANSAYKSAYAEAKAYYDEYYKKWYNSKVKTLQRANADRYDQYRESRAKTDEKAKIKRMMKKLSSALLSPTEGNYVPTELYESIIDVCRAVNLTNNYDTKVGKQFERFQQQYEALKSVTEGDYAGEHDEVMADRIKRMNEMMGERSIASLTLSELMELRMILQDVSNTLIDARIQIGVEEKIANYELGDRAIREIRDADKYRALNKKYSGNMLSSMRLVDMICDYDPNAVLNVKFHELNEGVRKMNQFIMESSKPFEELQKKNKGKDYEDFITRTYDVGFVDENGNAVPVTMAQMCQIRLSYEREQADSRLKHIQNGGIIIPDSKLVEQGKRKEAKDKGARVRNVNSITIDNINEILNDYAKKWLDTAYEFFNVRSKAAINEVSRVTMHRNVAISKNYIPLVVEDNFAATEVKAVSFNASLQSMGLLQSITHSAPQPIVIEGLNAVVDQHIHNVGKQYGLAIPIRNLNKIYKVQQIGGNDSVKKAFATTWGRLGASSKDCDNIVEQVLADLQSNRKSDTWEVLNKIHDGVVQAVLNGNLSVSIKQAASYWAAGYIVSEGALHKGLLRSGYVLKNMQSVFDEIDQHAGAQHYMRRKGLSIQEIGDLVQKKHFSDKLPGVLNGRKWIQAVDVFTTALIWEACKIDVANNVKKGKAA